MRRLNRAKVFAALAGLLVLGLIFFAGAGNRLVAVTHADPVAGHPQNEPAPTSPIPAAALINPLKMLHIADNLGTNWVNKGYPVAKGE